MRFIRILVIILFSLYINQTGSSQSATETVERYFQAIKSGNYKKAVNYLFSVRGNKEIREMYAATMRSSPVKTSLKKIIDVYQSKYVDDFNRPFKLFKISVAQSMSFYDPAYNTGFSSSTGGENTLSYIITIKENNKWYVATMEDVFYLGILIPDDIRARIGS